MFKIITIEDLAKALEKKIGLSSEEAEFYANYFMNFFGFDGYFPDSLLMRDERSMLYFFQENEIVDHRVEEYYLRNGRKWRISYWYLREDEIKRILEEKEEDSLAKLYDPLPDDIWQSR